MAQAGLSSGKKTLLRMGVQRRGTTGDQYRGNYTMKNYTYVPETPEETLEDRMTHLYEMKSEYRAKQKAFKEENRHLLETIKSLENIVIAEVIQLKRTVKVDGIRAEYKPQVIIKIKKENSHD